MRIQRTLLTLGLLCGLIVAPAAAGFGPAGIARAAGSPDIELAKEMPSEILYGLDIPVSLVVTNPAGPDGFNTLFTDTLPVGASYVAGSGSPEPTSITVLGNGRTLLVWNNVADILTGTTVRLGYSMAIDSAVFAAGETVSNSARAFTHSDPRTVPKSNDLGGALPGTFTGNDGATATTELIPFELTKTGGTAEDELLRGVHTQQTVYTLRVDNNAINATNGFTLVDYLPAQLEFLGCNPIVDNSTVGEEYTGSGPIPNGAVTTNPCPTASSVTTVTTDPDGATGPMPSGVYTRVEWNAASLTAALGSADLAANGFFSIDYITAIPLRANVQATLADPTANLDNNTGSLTTETLGETELRNYAEASGTYHTNASPTTDSDIDMATIEDISIHKTVDVPEFDQTSTPVYTLTIETSEYATATGPITVTDDIPAILDFVSATPASDPLIPPVLNADGTITYTWTLPAFSAPNGVATIVINTDVREAYRNGDGSPGEPVASNDSVANTTDLAADVSIITDPLDPTNPTVVTLVDESVATQTSPGPVISKDVGLPGPSPLNCGNGAGVTFDPEFASYYRPGDRVCFRLTVEFPPELDTIDPIVDDFLPDGFAYESFAYGPANTISTPGIVFEAVAPRLRWDLSDVDRGGSRFEVIVQTVISDPTLFVSNDIADNLMKLRYSNVSGGVFQLRDAALAELREAVLGLTKGVTQLNGSAVAGAPADGVIVQEGDVVTYQVAVANSGTETATNTSVRDVLPADVTCSDVVPGSISNGGACDAANGWIQWDPSDNITVAGGSTINLTYRVTVPSGISAGATLTNTAGVRQYTGATNSGTPFIYIPSSNIDPTLTPNTDPAIDTSNVVTNLPTIAKTRTTSLTGSGNAAANEATVGETVSYTIDLTLPGGTSFYNAVLGDALDAEHDLVESSVVVTRNGAAVPVAPALPASSNFAISTTGNAVAVTFPTPYSVANGPDQAIRMTFDAVVTDVASNVRTTSVDNRVDFDFENAGGVGRNVNASVATQIVEPNIALDKSNSIAGGQVGAGQTVTYTVTVRNVAGTAVSSAYDTVVVDTVPPELAVQVGSISNGGIFAPGATASDPSTITWTIATIDPGASVALTYDVITADPLIAGSQLQNTADADTTSLPGVVAGERTSASPHGDAVGDGYTDPADSTLGVPALAVAKAADPATATIGASVTYTVDVTIPGGVVAYDVTVIDGIPAGITYESLTSIACDQAGGACSPDITVADVTVIPAAAPADGDDIAFFFDDLGTAAVADRVVTITYVGFVSDTAAADSGATLTNGATLYWNAVDTIPTAPATVPAPGDFTSSSPVASDSVGTVEPLLVIDKDVTGQVGDTDTRRAKPGDVLAYSLTITNTGTAPAYDVSVSDLATNTTWAFADTTAAGVATNTDAVPAGGLAWVIDGPIAVGGTATITYTLTVPAGYDSADEVAAGPEQSNTADVPSYFAAPVAVRLANPGRDYRDYDNVVADTVTIELDLASIGDDVWFDVNNDGIQQPTEPVLANVDVTVTYLGADNTLGTADDEVFSAVTGLDGKYLVEDLPGGQYVVDVDETDADFITGLVPSYDLDGGTSTPNGSSAATLGEDEDKTDVDFGYTGNGSIAQTVWFDQNLDGVVDANEAGIADATVTVTWGGPDGDLSTPADNLVYVATTDANGEYLVENLPPGEYSVVVTDVPAGYVNVSEPGAGLDSANSLTLAVGEDNVDQNFGYAGLGTIGDFIWLDQSDDGVQDAGEPGLGGVMVQLTSFGPDGVAGGGDDTVVMTTTAADGSYRFENLPPGAFEVEVTGGIPANVRNTYDPDVAGPGNSVSSVTLTIAEPDDLDQDFGYYAASTLGDRVWFDVDNSGGVDDGTEPGIVGVQVTATYFGPDGVLGGADDEVFVTTTSSTGDYLFVNVPDGNYRVAITDGIAAGLTQTFDSSGSPSDGASNVTLATQNLLQDFSYTGNGSIGDRIWFDSNEDGVLDAGETGLAGVAVTLTWYGPDGVAGGGDDIVLTTTTNATGQYLFPNLPDGEFLVEVDETTLPSGLTPTYDRDGMLATPDGSTRVSLTAGADVIDVDFGYSGSGSIGDTIWFDRDGDGVFDADEYPLVGVTVQLVWDSPTGPQTYTTTTNAAGQYLFSNLPPGDYDINVVTSTLPAGLTATFDGDQVANGLGNTSAEALAQGESNISQDFGYNGSAAIGDTIYLDLDGSGTQDPGEPGIVGQVVELTWNDAPGGPQTYTTTTGANGSYLFDNLPDGNFTVEVVGGIVNVSTNTGDPTGPGVGDSTNVVTIAGGVDRLDQDFGYRGINSIGDMVFWDQDANGVDDATDPGLPNVDVTLVWFGLNGVAGGGDDVTYPVRVTDAAGGYEFDGLPDGSYSVTVTDGLPAGLDTNTFDGDDLTVNPNGTSVIDWSRRR